jgi:hypothetical protein
VLFGDRALAARADVRWLHPAVARVKAVAMAEEHGAEARVPVEQALYGLEVHPLPRGWTPISAIVLVRENLRRQCVEASSNACTSA